jgi:CarD family transcriptional regulator
MRNGIKKKVTKAKAPKAKASKGRATKTKVAKVHAAKGHPAKTKAAQAAPRKPVVTKPVAAKPGPVRPEAAKPVAKIVVAKPEAAKIDLAKVVAAKPAKPAPKPEPPFSEGDYVVYPTHGVGRVQAIVRQQIAGQDLELFVITFDRDRMTLRVPVPKARQSGLRKLSSHTVMETALTTLRGRARVKRTMWSRRAQEYEAKINSGDPVSIAEVVRDLHRHANQPDQSYSERQIYEAALERLASELAAVDGIERDKATQKLETLLDAA